MRRKRQVVLHPLFFTLFPILFLFSHNWSESLALSQVLLPLAISLLSTFLFWGLLNLAFRNLRKSALIVSLVVLLFFSFGHFHTALVGLTVAGINLWQHRYLLVAYAIVVLLAFIWTCKTSKKLDRLTAILNLVSILLVVISLINISVYTIRKGALSRKLEGARSETLSPTAPGDDDPDIYYIILDAYANSHTLREVHNYDNSEFVGFLERKGFYLADKSCSNYPFTAASLSSSLNFEYPDYLWSNQEDPADIWAALVYLIENNKTIRLLKSRGYKFVHFDAGFSCNESNRHADIQLRYGYANEFLAVLVQSTLLSPFRRSLNLLASDHRERILGIFAGIAEVHHQVPGPKFVFAHLACPRGPFVFGPEGEKVNFDHAAEPNWRKRQAYADQVKFINSKVREVVEVLLAPSAHPPIVIIQADHGIVPAEDGVDDQSDRHLQSMMRIFNAYFLPDVGREVLYPSISPVNTFRLIFNEYFGRDYPLLPDRSYYRWNGYDFSDVTERVRFPREGE